MATLGNITVEVDTSGPYEALREMGRGAGTALLVEAAHKLASLSIQVSEPDAIDDGIYVEFCSVCQRACVTGRELLHADSCAVGHVLRAIAGLKSMETRLRPKLVTGLAEREVVLDPVVHPTPEELA